MSALVPVIRGKVKPYEKGSIIESTITLPWFSYIILILFLIPLIGLFALILIRPDILLHLFYHATGPFSVMGQLSGAILLTCIAPFWSSYFYREAGKAEQFLWITLEASSISGLD